MLIDPVGDGPPQFAVVQRVGAIIGDAFQGVGQLGNLERISHIARLTIVAQGKVSRTGCIRKHSVIALREVESGLGW